MTTEQTAQQLELAAQIIRTGHPWETSHNKERWWLITSDDDPAVHVVNNQHIRLALATPPDGRPLHNPDNLTAEQVGAGYRLALPEEMDGRFWNGRDMCEWWSPRGEKWKKTDQEFPLDCPTDTLRLPLSVPWPEPQPDPYAELKKAHAEGKVIECITGTDRRWMAMQGEPRWFLPVEDYRIKPEEPFQLPPPPPGMQWHRTDGWKEGDLPQGCRPLVVNENGEVGDEWFSWCDQNWKHCDEVEKNVASTCCKHRTRRPLTFTHAGKQWTWHRPGDPRPVQDCDRIEWLLDREATGELPFKQSVKEAWEIGKNWNNIIGWRYADEKKPHDETIQELSDKEIIQLRNLLTLFTNLSKTLNENR